jgi:amino acid transporter
MPTAAQALKRFFLGRPIATEEAGHQLLPVLLALPVFASDALSSNAYATEEILHVLNDAGRMALSKSLPIAMAVGALLVVVVTSYRQTVRAYPRGGGSYIVTKENLGTTAGLVAGAALLTDYILTVAVSIAAGAFAMASLMHGLLEHRVALSLAFIALVTIMNLRGVKESGVLFAIPTYAFILSVFAMLITGFVRCLGTCPVAEVPNPIPPGVHALSLFIILRAFSSGSTALTGVEAIADGVAAFRGRRPAEQARNAAKTLGLLGVVSVTLFLGITYLANQMHAAPSRERSVVAQVAHGAFGGGFGFALVQITTALILVLAANTAYQDFPRLSSILARDRFMPRQFINRGDRLVFSNGVLVLASLAGLLIVLYHAEVSRLIQLYVVGVFTSFTLSQTGMVLRWRRLRDPGWRGRAVVNGIGAVVTGVVLIVVAVTKFTHGAWIVIVTVPIIVMGFKAIGRHYQSVTHQLRLPEARPPLTAETRAVVLVAGLDEATLRAVGYARAMRPLELRALHVGTGAADEALRSEWNARQIGVPLELVPDTGDLVDSVRSYVRGIERGRAEFITVIIPERVRRRGWRYYLRGRRKLLLKAGLLFEPNVVVTNVPSIAPEEAAPLPPGRGAIVPARIRAVVLVSAVHNAALRAVAYARALSPHDLRAVTFQLEPEDTETIVSAWIEWGVDVPLEVLDSPYREVTRPLVRYVRTLRDRFPDSVVSVVVPEFVVSKWWHQFLHNQTALAIKAALLFEPGIVVTSVPYHLT